MSIQLFASKGLKPENTSCLIFEISDDILSQVELSGIYTVFLNPALFIVVYEITVETGDIRGAGTDAKVYVTVFGSKGHTPKVLLANR